MFGESNGLPPSLIEAILLLLDVHDIAICLNVNRYMRRVSQLVDDRVHERNIRSRHLNQMQSQFMKMGYMEGVERGRERLMQDGFNEGFSAGNFTGFQPGFHMGMLAALSLFAWSHDDILSPSDRSKICRFNDDVNSRVMHIGLDIPSKPSSSSGSGTAAGEVEIRRKSKRKQPAATSTPRESSTSPPRVSSSHHGHSHGAPTAHGDNHHNHGHGHHGNGDGSDSDSGHSSDDGSSTIIVSAAPSTSRLVDLEDNTDIVSSSSIGGAGSSSSSSSSVPSSTSLTAGPAAGLIAVNMDDVRRQCGTIATNLSLSITPILAAIRRAPVSLKHTRADDPLFGREDREIPLSFLGDRQMAARNGNGTAPSLSSSTGGDGSHIHSSIMDSVVHSHDLDDDFM